MANDTRLTIEEFPGWLQEQQDEVTRRVARFLFDVTGLIQKQTIRNIRDTFGTNPATPRAGASGRPTGSGRGLANSVTRQFDPSDESVTVSVGGTSAPYAHIQEFGGTIRPKNVSWLTIPNVQTFPWMAGKRAREFNALRFVPLGPTAAALVDPKLVEFHSGGDGESDLPFRETVLFWLRKRVVLPPRPYFQPAIESVLASADVRRLMQRHLGVEVDPGKIPEGSLLRGPRGSMSTS